MRFSSASLALATCAGLWLASSGIAAVPTVRPSDAERGEELYRRHCVMCHGVRNRGDGPATAALVAPVPLLVGKVAPNERLVEIVLKGKLSMPAYEASFDRPDARRVLQYMNRLGPNASLPDVQSPPQAGKPGPRVDDEEEANEE